MLYGQNKDEEMKEEVNIDSGRNNAGWGILKCQKGVGRRKVSGADPEDVGKSATEALAKRRD